MPPSTGSSPWWPSTTACGGGKLAGHRSCAHWLAFRCGYSLGAARERVRAARALADLPETSAAMSRGELSFCAVRALTRVATPENEADLLDLARGATTAQLERMVRGFKLGSRQEEADREKERFESRCFSVFPDEEGMYEVKGRLTPEVGALLMRAVEAASDALYREKGPKSVSYETSFEDAAHRRADALGLVAERALAAGFDSPGQHARAPLSGTRAERYQVLLHVDAETLTEDGSGLGQSELEDGTRVSYETSRRLACDASVVRIGHASDRSVLDVGRKTRTIPPCGAPGARGAGTGAAGSRAADSGSPTRTTSSTGPTEARRSSNNLLLLCSHHHRLLHEEGWKVEWWGKDRQPAFIDPEGAHAHGAAARGAKARAESGRSAHRRHPQPRSRPRLLHRQARAGSARPTSRTTSTSRPSRRWDEERAGKTVPRPVLRHTLYPLRSVTVVARASAVSASLSDGR